jgi:ribosomal protein S18 acetylase RimI-like enzyme
VSRPAEHDVTVRLELATDREALVPILLEADEEAALRGYLHDGDVYRVLADDELIGVVLLIRDRADTIEIKNIALLEGHRRRGLGRATVEAVAELARRSRATRLVVGTADSAAGTIEFYRRAGFRDAGRIEGFFDAYPEPVLVDGIVAHDMVRFEMDLYRMRSSMTKLALATMKASTRIDAGCDRDQGNAYRSLPVGSYAGRERARLYRWPRRAPARSVGPASRRRRHRGRHPAPGRHVSLADHRALLPGPWGPRRGRSSLTRLDLGRRSRTTA